MDQFSRRLIGVGVQRGTVDGPSLCRMFNDAVRRQSTSRHLSTDHDPLFKDHRWHAYLRVPEIDEVKTVPHVSGFTAITKDSLPLMTPPQGSYEPVGHFPDQAPIGIHPDGQWILICLLTQEAKRELRAFLDRHLMFLSALPTWTLRVVIPAHMTAHGMGFVDEVRRNLRWRFDG